MYFDPKSEKEVSTRLRQLVDNCIEEGHYETAISNLDKLRSPTSRPSVSHILQLIALALYPPPDPVHKPKLINASPRKLGGKGPDAQHVPSADATRAAVILLDAFARTNHPITLTAGLPRYYQQGGDPFFEQQEGYLGDLRSAHTFTAPIGLKIAQQVNFWSCLRPEFIIRPDSRHDEPEDECYVAPSAWHVLRWFLDLCRKDEDISQNSNEGHYSRVLLHQIPAPRTGPRWECIPTIRIILECFQTRQGVSVEEPQLRSLAGGKFLDMMIHLLKGPQIVSTSHFLNQLCSQLDSLSPNDANRVLAAIYPQHDDFKVTLCRTYISRLSEAEQKAAPQRPRPKARPIAKGGLGAGATPQPPAPAPATASKPANPFQFPTTGEILTLLQTPLHDLRDSDASMPERMLGVKFHLLSAYGNARVEKVDASWMELIQSGTFQGLMQQVFRNPEDQAETKTDYLALIQLLQSFWSSSGTSIN